MAIEDRAPQGVIINNNVAYVGVEHKNRLELSNSLVKKIADIGDRYGYWYEGNGDDNKETSAAFAPRQIFYKGCWDDGFSRTIGLHEPWCFYTLFSNGESGEKEKVLLRNDSRTIFEMLIEHKDKISYGNAIATRENLVKFLEGGKNGNYNPMEQSLQMATTSNVNKFIDDGWAQMWPTNWTSWPNPLGRNFAKIATDLRDKYLLSQTSGVYFAGSGHLKNLVKLNPQLKMIDGSRIF